MEESHSISNDSVFHYDKKEDYKRKSCISQTLYMFYAALHSRKKIITKKKKKTDKCKIPNMLFVTLYNVCYFSISFFFYLEDYFCDCFFYL